MCTPGDRPHNSRWMRTRGQAAVETAITMPLVVFMLLGTLQLFMLLQGRIMAEHAAFKAVRAGSVNHGSCVSMTHAAIAALLPSFTTFLGSTTPGSTPQEKFVNAFRARTQGHVGQNGFDPALDVVKKGTTQQALNNAIVWIYRVSPTPADVTPLSEDDFDDPDPVMRGVPPTLQSGYRLDARFVYWMPMRIPFANWVMANMLRAYFGLGAYSAANPTMPVTNATWTKEPSATTLAGPIAAEFLGRFNAQQYSFPIVASASMHMMTPPRNANFITPHCTPAPVFP